MRSTLLSEMKQLPRVEDLRLELGVSLSRGVPWGRGQLQCERRIHSMCSELCNWFRKRPQGSPNPHTHYHHHSESSADVALNVSLGETRGRGKWTGSHWVIRPKFRHEHVTKCGCLILVTFVQGSGLGSPTVE